MRTTGCIHHMCGYPVDTCENHVTWFVMICRDGWDMCSHILKLSARLANHMLRYICLSRTGHNVQTYRLKYSEEGVSLSQLS
jgi:hypothetical protein